MIQYFLYFFSKCDERDRLTKAEEEQRELKKQAISDSELKAEIELMNQLRMKVLGRNFTNQCSFDDLKDLL